MIVSAGVDERKMLASGLWCLCWEVTLKVAVAEGGEPPASKFDDSSQGFE
jgi:hypothetical protein